MVALGLAKPDEAYEIASVLHWSLQTDAIGPLRSGSADPEQLIRYNADKRLKKILGDMQTTPIVSGITVRESAKDDLLCGEVIIVARDDNSSEILGIAIWILPPLDAYAQKNPFTKRDTSTRPSDLPEGANWEIMAHVSKLGDQNFEELNTRPYFYLANLAVSPAAQGKGVGRKLLAWGLSRAQIDGIHAGLGASDSGYPVYLKLGFFDYAPPLRVVDEVSMARMRWEPQ